MNPWHMTASTLLSVLLFNCLFSRSKNNEGLYTCPASLYHQVIPHPNCSVSAPTLLMVIDMGGTLSLSTGSCYHIQDVLKYFGEDLMSLFGPLTTSRRTGLCLASYPPLLVHFFLDCPTLKVFKSALLTHTLFWLHPHRRPCSLSIASSLILSVPACVLLCHRCLSLIALSGCSHPYFSGLTQEWHPPGGPPRHPLVKSSLAPWAVYPTCLIAL